VNVGTAVVGEKEVCVIDVGGITTGKLVAVDVGSDKPHESEINTKIPKRNNRFDRAGFFMGFNVTAQAADAAMLERDGGTKGD
jgi:hypothetical protein